MKETNNRVTTRKNKQLLTYNPEGYTVTDLTSLYTLFPYSNHIHLQTAGVSVRTRDGVLVLLTLQSFERCTKIITLPHFSSLLEAIKTLSATDLSDAKTYNRKVKALGRIRDFSHVSTEDSRDSQFVLAYNLPTGTLISWKNSPWTRDDVKDFLKNKGHLEIARYSTERKTSQSQAVAA